jgi:kynureninase
VRGSQVSFAFENGYAVMQALIAPGGDRRFSRTRRDAIWLYALYISENDVVAAVDVLENTLKNRLWDTSEFRKANRVT